MTVGRLATRAQSLHERVPCFIKVSRERQGRSARIGHLIEAPFDCPARYVDRAGLNTDQPGYGHSRQQLIELRPVVVRSHTCDALFEVMCGHRSPRGVQQVKDKELQWCDVREPVLLRSVLRPIGADLPRPSSRHTSTSMPAETENTKLTFCTLDEGRGHAT